MFSFLRKAKKKKLSIEQIYQDAGQNIGLTRAKGENFSDFQMRLIEKSTEILSKKPSGVNSKYSELNGTYEQTAWKILNSFVAGA